MGASATYHKRAEATSSGQGQMDGVVDTGYEDKAKKERDDLMTRRAVSSYSVR